MKIQYTDHSFRNDTLALIEIANTIIEDYQARGYELTLRQLYYQLVARDLIPNNEKMYKKLGGNISKARDAGLVDWEAIVDRTRSRKGLPTWLNPGEIIKSAARDFRIDKWDNQDYKIFVWVEKEALAGVIARACDNEDVQVDYISCKGYMSASTIWREAQSMRYWSDMDKTPIIIHLGDHDPSGIDMTRDNIKRLELYSGLKMKKDLLLHNPGYKVIEFELSRIALNYNQIEQYQPPPNPAKLTDTRAADYVDRFGYESWELDALDPDVLVDMIQEEINGYKDLDKWNEMVKLENEYKERLEYVADNWESI